MGRLKTLGNAILASSLVGAIGFFILHMTGETPSSRETFFKILFVLVLGMTAYAIGSVWEMKRPG
jgi:hypothetical protein